ncbi:MAG: M56 family metallopeptidase, partial [Clostridia bacterium]|nr:M56 family metallopeptidase [Clostridia bacterium]
LAALSLICPFRMQSQLSVFSTTEPILSVVTHNEYAVTQTAQVIVTEHAASQDTAETDAAVTDVPVFSVDGGVVSTVKPGEIPSALPYAEYPLEHAGGAQIPTGKSHDFLRIGSTVWLVGCGGMLLYALLQYLRLKKRVAVSVPFVDGVYLCDAIDTPFVLGFLPPKIYLPSALTDGDFCPVIAHERAHIRRGDPFWKVFGYAILCLHWFNPLLWVCYPLFCADLEFACDERAVGGLDMDERRAYAEAMLSCSIGARRVHSISQPLAFGEVGVRERVTAVLEHKSAKWYQVTAVMLLCALLGGCFLTEPVRGYTDVLKQNGYTVHKAELYQTLEITVPAELVSEYAKNGATVLYDAGDVVVYDCAPTTLSLTKIMPMGDGDDYWMDFTFSYSAIPTEGVLTTLLRPEYKNEDVTLWSTIPHIVGDVRDASQNYPDGAECLYEQEGVTFGIRIDREVLANADAFLTFTVGGLSDVYYSRGEKNPTDKITVTEGGTVGPDSILVNLYKNAEYYVSERCIYMTPLSSSVSIGGDTGYRYLIDPEQNSFCQIHRDTGSIQMVGSLLGGWKDFLWTDEEWSAMFLFIEYNDRPISETYSERKVLALSADQYLLSMDGELWLMKLGKNPDGSAYVWSIHELVPEADKGVAYYRYAPAVSAFPPYLTITFDLPGITEISAYCGETALASAPTKGREQLTWYPSWNNDDGEMQVCWSPTERTDGDIPSGVEQASIIFTALNDEKTRYCAGTVYITRDEKASSPGDDWYQVTVVGNGMTVTADENGWGAVIHWDGDGVILDRATIE